MKTRVYSKQELIVSRQQHTFKTNVTHVSFQGRPSLLGFSSAGNLLYYQHGF